MVQAVGAEFPLVLLFLVIRDTDAQTISMLDVHVVQYYLKRRISGIPS